MLFEFWSNHQLVFEQKEKGQEKSLKLWYLVTYTSLKLSYSQATNSCLLATFGIRTGFSEEQLTELNDFFHNVSKYPDKSQKHQLSQQLGITMSQVSIWFNNKRNKRKL